jgi:hypothetical protein
MTEPRTRSRWPFTALRVTSTTLAVLAALQAFLAGSFLNGQYAMLTAHSTVAVMMIVVAVVQAVFAVIARRAGAPRQLLIPGLVMPFVIAAQAALGDARIIGVHVLLGSLMVFGLFQLAATIWRRPAVPSNVDIDIAGSAARS